MDSGWDIERSAPPLPAERRDRGHGAGDIAVVGMSARLPDAPDIDRFWRNLLAGHVAVRDVPPSRWNIDEIYDPNSQSGHRSITRRGGFIEDIDRFDPRFFRITPREALHLDPQQRLFLEESWKAIEEAGYSDRDMDGVRCSVFVGCRGADYQFRILGGSDEDLAKVESYMLTGNEISMLPGRLSFFLNLRGPSVPIVTACSSSLVALHLACESLLTGSADMAIASGVEVMTTPAMFVSLSDAGVVSPTGACRAFDDGADGMVMGEGAISVLLKRLDDAVRDGDHIWGVVKATEVNQDGRSNGIHAPNGQSQALLEAAVYRKAGINPETIGFVETHGTGTLLGDPVEMRALTEAFGWFTARRQFCALGAVKTNIGHPLAAAGLAGLVKVLLSLKHGRIPPTANFTTPNRHIDFANSPFFVNDQPIDWPAPDGHPRRAALSSFGYTGTNAHALIEEAPPAPPPTPGRPPFLFLLSGKTEEALRRRSEDLCRWLAAAPGASPADVAYTLHRGRSHFGRRLAVLADDLTELRRRLESGDTIAPDDRLPAGDAAGLERRLAALLGRDGISDAARRGALVALGQLYLKGHLPDWRSLHPVPGRRIGLPTYPFARERYWLDVPTSAITWPPGRRLPETAGKAGAVPVRPIPAHPVAPGGTTAGTAAETVAETAVDETRLWTDGWVAAPCPAASGPAGDILLFDHGDSLARSLSQAGAGRVVLVTPGDGFAARSDDRFTLNPARRSDYEALFAALADRGLRPLRIVVAWSAAASGGGEALADRLARGPHALLALFQAAVRSNPPDALRIVAVAGGAMAADLAADPVFVALAGFARSAALEHPRVQVRTVVLDGEPADPAQAAHLLRELSGAEAAGAEIRYAGGGRQRRVWRLCGPADASPAAAPLVRPGSVWLITGGSGGIGGILAGHLARTARVRLVLTGRRAADAGIAGLIDRLRAEGGEAVYVPADLGDADAARRLVAAARDRFGPLNGVIHAAGVNRDARLMAKTAADLDAVFAPKIAGTLALDEATADEPLDGFVLTSSLAAVMGNVGQSDYAYANAFLDAFAAARETLRGQGRRHGRSLAIDWPYWAEGGMRIPAEMLAEIRRHTGLAVLTTEAGLRAWEEVQRIPFARCAVSHGDAGRLAALIAQQAPVPAPVPARAETPAAGADRARSMLRTIMADVTGLHEEEIDEDRDFEEYGIDSVKIKSFNVQLEALVGELPRTLLFECRNLAELHRYLAEHHGDALDRSVRTPVPAPAAVAVPAAPAVPVAAAAPEAGGRDIAIIGIGLRYPQAEDADAFWDRLAAGYDGVVEVPPDRWDWRRHFDPDPEKAVLGRMYCKWGGFIDGADRFDAGFFNISPREAEVMDPQERLFLETAWATLENAGHVPARKGAGTLEPGARVGVFVGVTTNSYQLFGPEQWSRGNPVIPVSAPWSIANRVSYLFDFTGPSLPVDTACSSSLVAVHLACDSILRGECEMALVGGVNLYLHPSKYIGMSQVRMLSPRGRCHSFGADADGFVPGEGVGAMLLKPLAAAERDGDHIHGVIKGTSVNHGGRTNSYTVPNPNAQAALVAEALRCAVVAPDSIGYVEAHGTGTALGDPIEIRGLTKAFAGVAPQSCAIGSLKSNIGHLEAAAGIAGLTKLLLQMEHGAFAPTLHAERLNPDIRFDATPFVVQRERAPWPEKDGRRRGAVSSFGAGGVNAHVIVEQHRPPAATAEPAAEGGHVFVLSARTAGQLRAVAARLAAWLRRRAGEGRMPALGDVAYTLQTGREAMKARLAVLADGVDDLLARLDAYLDGTAADGTVITGDSAASGGLAGRWVRGETVDWAALHRGKGRRRVPLPGYPFDRRRYWIPTVEEAPAEPLLHPLVHRALPGGPGSRFGTRMDGGEFYLRDHIVGGKPVLPGVAFLEMVRAAGGLAGEPPVERLTGVVWVQRFAVERPGAALEITLKPDGDSAAFEVVSPGDAPVPHIQGRLHRRSGRPADPPSPLDLEAIRARCPVRREVTDCYRDGDESAAVRIGPSLRSIRTLDCGTGEVLARLELPDEAADPQGAFVLHPSLLDGAIQTVVGLGDGDFRQLFFPFSIGAVGIFGRLTSPCHAHLVVRRRDPNGQALVADVTIADDRGAVLARLSDFTFRLLDAGGLDRRADRGRATPRDRLSLAVEWQTAALPAGAEAPLGPYLLFDQGTRRAEALRRHLAELGDVAAALVLVQPGERFEATGAHTYSVAPGREEDFAALAERLEERGDLPRHIVFLWPDGAAGEGEGAEGEGGEAAALDRGIHSLYALVRTLAPRLGTGPAVTVLVAWTGTGTGAGTAGEPQPLNEALGAFARSAGLEKLPLRFKALALPGGLGEADVWPLILAELSEAAPFEPEVRLDGGVRRVPRLREQALPSAAAAPFRQGGVYLVTGASGKLGSLVAGHLARRWGAKLVLTGRRAPDPDGPLAALLAPGRDALYVPADLGNAGEVAALVAAARTRFGRIDGIVHAAGLLTEEHMTARRREDVAAVLVPKIRGARLLDDATAGEPLDLFLLFSSTAAPLGNALQPDYAYANAVLDGFAERREAQRRAGARSGRTVSVNWPLWRDGRIGAVLPALLSWLERTLGLLPLGTEVGLEILELAAASGRPRVMVVEGDRQRLLRGLGVAGAAVVPAPAKAAEPIARPPAEDVQAELRRIASGLLKLAAEEIDPDTELSEYGFESISLIEFTNAINGRFGTELMPTVFFEHRSIASLARHLGGQPGFRVGTAQPVEAVPAAPPASALAPAPVMPVALPAAVCADEPVAIVGMSGMMPMSEDLDRFWANLVDERDLISEVPGDRWRWQDYYGDPARDPNKTWARWGGFMPHVDRFDPLFFGISPREGALMDPQHRLVLQHAWKAVENAGHRVSDLAGTRTAVFIGLANNDYAALIRDRLSVMEPHGPLGNSNCILPNRVSYLLNLHGPSEPVDTGCSSTAIAIHRAVRAIRHDGCAMALAGGVNVILNPWQNIFFSQAGVLSRDGRCRAFDSEATGTVRGEGVGVFLLKPLSRALADGNPIHALIRGTAENHGGRSSSLTAPNPAAQADLIVAAYEAAGVDPATVGYIEAHGTGTKLGDPVEVEGVLRAFDRLHRGLGTTPPPDRRIGLGSVKTNVGHLEPAAAAAGIAKVVQAMKHGRIPASLHFETLNPFIRLEGTPFEVVSRTRSWEPVAGPDGRPLPRRAGVSSFGMGGANAHIVLEEYVPPPDPAAAAPGPQLFTLSAKDEDRLRDYAVAMVGFLEEGAGGATLSAVCHTARVGRDAMPRRLAVVVSSLDELDERLRAFLDGAADPRLFRSDDRADGGMAALLGKEAGESFLRDLTARRDLPALARLWAMGAAVDWSGLDAAPPRRVCLPSYPFAPFRCWIGEDGQTQFHPADQSASDPESPALSVYRYEWVPEEAAAVPALSLDDGMLIVGADEAIRAAVAVRAGIAVDSVAAVPPGAAVGDCRRVLERLAAGGRSLPGAVVLLLTAPDLIPDDPDDVEGALGAVERAVELGVRPVVEVVHAYTAAGQRQALKRVVALYRSGGAPDGALEKAAGNPGAEMLGAFGKSLQLLFPNLSFAAVGLPDGAGADAPAALADALVRELAQDGPADRWRDGGRALAHVIRPHRLAGGKAVGARAPLRRGGVYLISGGLGGLGLIVARHLAGRYGARLGLLGRSPLDAAREAELEGVRALGGEAVYYAVDVADAAAVAAAVADLTGRFGPLNGVVHSAGVADKRLVTDKSMADIRRTLRPKLAGTLALDHATRTEPLDFFVLFSSTSVQLGDMGQGDYALSNQFMDRFARLRADWRRTGRRAGRTLSINWPLWRDGGLHLDGGDEEALRYSGMDYLETADGLAVFERLLAEDLPQAIVLAVRDHARVDRFLGIGGGSGSDVPAPQPVPPSAGTREPGRAPAVSLAGEGPLGDRLEQDLRGMAAELLDLDPARLERDRSLVDYGFDSINVTAFVRRINDRYPFADVNQMTLLQHQSLSALAGHLLAEHGEAMAGLFGVAPGEAGAPKPAAAHGPAPELLTLQRGGDRPHSFWVPGSFGFPQTFQALPRALGPDYPVHAFRFRGNDGRQEPFRDVQTMADHFVACMRAVQPEGPYVIGGYSWGGLVALEMARRVAGAGQRVQELILLDTYPPCEAVHAMTQVPESLREIKLILANFLTGFGHESGVIGDHDLDGVPEEEHFRHLARLVSERGRSGLPEEELFGYLSGASRVNDLASEAYRSYAVGAYDASPVLYVRAKPGADAHIGDYDYFRHWPGIVRSRLEVINTPLRHAELMTEPALALTAARLRLAIDGAAPRRRPAP
ncbi:SDR family NAD(P)-dependent oxidoreductase [Azospirillum argentinense]|uniref:SDR family NAD(P)-dependent oxidoreductase n=1 Tax=Azospirillum argentinense TaxID=2970906 RepID=UPI000AD71C6D|nr:SDR family NAD(P)-dependent oxidoreductase [Azospirillum argentinense]